MSKLTIQEKQFLHEERKRLVDDIQRDGTRIKSDRSTYLRIIQSLEADNAALRKGLERLTDTLTYAEFQDAKDAARKLLEGS